MATHETTTGSLCPHCYKFGVRVIGEVSVGETVFKNVKICRFCAARFEGDDANERSGK